MAHILCLQHKPEEAPGLVADWAMKAGHSIEVIHMDRNAPPDPELAGDLLVILGGPMGVYEEDAYPWLRKEKQCIRHWIDSRRPALGICLGAQLLAEVLGGRVYPHRHQEIGWFPVRLNAAGRAHPVVSALLPEQSYFHWHGDTFDLPPGAELLAESDATPHQAFAWGERIVGLQFHPELNHHVLRLWEADTTEDEVVPDVHVQPLAALWQDNGHIGEITPRLFDLLDRLLATGRQALKRQ